jgi:iron uptake system component EfeO
MNRTKTVGAVVVGLVVVFLIAAHDNTPTPTAAPTVAAPVPVATDPAPSTVPTTMLPPSTAPLAVPADASQPAAVAAYVDFVRKQADQLAAQTKTFVRFYTSDDLQSARTAYGPTRTAWQRIRPVAASLGDLVQRLDLRESDLAAGQAWTGWHRIEKDLSPPPDNRYRPLSAPERATVGAQLVADTEELQKRIAALTFTPTEIATTAQQLIEQMATSLDSPQEVWSGTELWDLQANVDGARAAFESLGRVIEPTHADLASTLTSAFRALDSVLAGYRRENGFKSFGELTGPERTVLAAAVKVVAEPLGRLNAAVAE